MFGGGIPRGGREPVGMRGKEDGNLVVNTNNYARFSPKRSEKKKKKNGKTPRLCVAEAPPTRLPLLPAISQSPVHAGGSLCQSEWPVIIIRTTGIFLLINFGISRHPCMFSTLLSSGGKVLAV